MSLLIVINFERRKKVKILHTADWHLGVKTMGKDRLEAQKHIIEEINEICKERNIDIVLIAGDVYNTSTPSALAEELFYDSVEKLSDNGNRLVVVLSGNHDDPERLCAGLPLSYKHNIVLAGGLETLNAERFVKGKAIEIVSCGEGFVKAKKGEETIVIGYLPFDSTLKARQNIENISYSALVGDIAKQSCLAFDKNSFNVFLSHLFVVGSRIARDRVVSVGDVFAVSKEDLPKADYVALGHIHANQNVAENIYYSGSISRLRPGDYDVSVNIVENNGHEVKVEKVILETPEKYIQIKVESIKEAENELGKLKETDLAELTFVISEPLKASEIKQLKKDYPMITSVSLELVSDADKNSQKGSVSRRNLSDKELFIAFYNKKKGVDPRDSLLDLFLECKGGRDETN